MNLKKRMQKKEINKKREIITKVIFLIILCALKKGMVSIMQLINIGFGNIVSAERIISIVSPESAPIKRMVQEAKDNKTAIDATYGRRTRAVIITDAGYLVLSAIQPETIAARIDKDIIGDLK